MKNKAAQQLGRLGGKAKTEAKSEAARENGVKGGRPRRWYFEGDAIRIRALVSQAGNPDSKELGYVWFKALPDRSLTNLYGHPIKARPSSDDVAGWGDLSGPRTDLVELEGGITQKAWLELAIDSALSE